MRKLYHIYLPGAYLCIALGTTNCTHSRIALAGLSGPVYRTDVDMEVKKAARAGAPDATTYVIGGGLKYRVVNTVDGVVRIKMIPEVGYNWPRPVAPTTPPNPPVVKTQSEVIADAKATAATSARAKANTSTATAARTNTSADISAAKLDEEAAIKAEEEEIAAVIPVAKSKKPATVNITVEEDKENTAIFEEIANNEVFLIDEPKMLDYNKVIVNQVVFGAMLLPIKIRPAREFNGIQYERHFATDVSVGPFIGYRFKNKGNNYKSFTTLGLFGGPGFVDYVTTTSQTGSPVTTTTQGTTTTTTTVTNAPTNGVNPDNMFAFTYGVGIVHEIDGFQLGLVYGADVVSGKRVKDWPYDGKGWFSLAIGYNFLSGSKK